MSLQDQTGSIQPRPEVTVSVVIPAYNPGDLVLEAVDSVLAQTLRDVEVIVVDNGSTDGLTERLLRYADAITVVRFPENRRPAAARNEGIRRSTGRYIALLDADDVWMPDRLRRLVDYMDGRPDIGFATTDSYLLVDGVKTDRSWFSTQGTTFHEQDQQIHIFEGNFLSNLLMFRRDLFERYGLFDENLWCEDWERNIEFIMHGEKAGIVREPLAYYRITPGSLSKSARLMMEDRRKILGQWLEKDLSPPVRRAARKALGAATWDCLKLDLFDRGAKGLRMDLVRLVLSAPISVKSKALLWLMLPSQIVGRLHQARLAYVVEHGGSWSLEEAIKALNRGDTQEAKGRLLATAIHSYPLRVRFWAVVWLMVPPLRGRAVQRLSTDPLLTPISPDASKGQGMGLVEVDDRIRRAHG